MQNFKRFLTKCLVCGSSTSKKYARANAGKCKPCATGIEPKGLKCPDCGEMTLTAYQKANHYHCDNCTKEADPEGYRRELMGYND